MGSLVFNHVEEIYERYIRSLSIRERLQLLEITARELSIQSQSQTQGSMKSIMELHGLGSEIWEGIDAQEYVNSLREEWDQDRDET